MVEPKQSAAEYVFLQHAKRLTEGLRFMRDNFIIPDKETSKKFAEHTINNFLFDLKNVTSTTVVFEDPGDGYTPTPKNKKPILKVKSGDKVLFAVNPNKDCKNIRILDVLFRNTDMGEDLFDASFSVIMKYYDEQYTLYQARIAYRQQRGIN